MLGWDSETALIAAVNLAPPLACITYSDGESCDIIHHADPGLKDCASWILKQETTTANGSYDLAVLWAAEPELRDLIWDAIEHGRVHDVVLRQKLIDLALGKLQRCYTKLPGEEKTTLLRYNLSDIRARETKCRMEKDEWRLRYGELRDYPLSQWPEGALQYAMGDAVEAVRAHDYQDREAANYNNRHLLDNLADAPFQVRANWALHLISCWGFATDLGRVEAVIADIDKEMPALIEKLTAVGLVRKKSKNSDVYTRSAKLAKEMMYIAVGDAGELTKTGYQKVKDGLLTKSDALRQGYIKCDEDWCKNSGYEALVDYCHYSQNQLLRTKLLSIRTAATYGLPVQTSFDTIKETGRTSSFENKIIINSMALQNPPSKGGLRGCFTARSGCTLIATDYGQVELVALAEVTYQAFGYSKMRDLINADRDIHVDFGSQIMGAQLGKVISYEDAFKMHKANGGIEYMTGRLVFEDMWATVEQQEKAGHKPSILMMGDMRTLAKCADFGYPGGLGWASFQSYAKKAWGVTLGAEQSKQLKKDWLRHFPEMADYFKWMGMLTERAGGLADIQQLVSGRWRGKCRYTAGCNTLFQGLAADAAKAALWEVSRLCYTVKSSDLYGCRPVLFVHDEIITEARLEQAAAAAAEQSKVMIEVYQRYTPNVKITADSHLMNFWSKKAEAEFDLTGKLIPWEPPQEEDERWEKELVAA